MSFFSSSISDFHESLSSSAVSDNVLPVPNISSIIPTVTVSKDEHVVPPIIESINVDDKKDPVIIFNNNDVSHTLLELKNSNVDTSICANLKSVHISVDRNETNFEFLPTNSVDNVVTPSKPEALFNKRMENEILSHLNENELYVMNKSTLSCDTKRPKNIQLIEEKEEDIFPIAQHDIELLYSFHSNSTIFCLNRIYQQCKFTILGQQEANQSFHSPPFPTNKNHPVKSEVLSLQELLEWFQLFRKDQRIIKCFDFIQEHSKIKIIPSICLNEYSLLDEIEEKLLRHSFSLPHLFFTICHIFVLARRTITDRLGSFLTIIHPAELFFLEELKHLAISCDRVNGTSDVNKDVHHDPIELEHLSRINKINTKLSSDILILNKPIPKRRRIIQLQHCEEQIGSLISSSLKDPLQKSQRAISVLSEQRCVSESSRYPSTIVEDTNVTKWQQDRIPKKNQSQHCIKRQPIEKQRHHETSNKQFEQPSHISTPSISSSKHHPHLNKHLKHRVNHDPPHSSNTFQRSTTLSKKHSKHHIEYEIGHDVPNQLRESHSVRLTKEISDSSSGSKYHKKNKVVLLDNKKHSRSVSIDGSQKDMMSQNDEKKIKQSRHHPMIHTKQIKTFPSDSHSEVTSDPSCTQILSDIQQEIMINNGSRFNSKVNTHKNMELYMNTVTTSFDHETASLLPESCLPELHTTQEPMILDSTISTLGNVTPPTSLIAQQSIEEDDDDDDRMSQYSIMTVTALDEDVLDHIIDSSSPVKSYQYVTQQGLYHNMDDAYDIMHHEIIDEDSHIKWDELSLNVEDHHHNLMTHESILKENNDTTANPIIGTLTTEMNDRMTEKEDNESEHNTSPLTPIHHDGNYPSDNHLRLIKEQDFKVNLSSFSTHHESCLHLYDTLTTECSQKDIHHPSNIEQSAVQSITQRTSDKVQEDRTHCGQSSDSADLAVIQHESVHQITPAINNHIIVSTIECVTNNETFPESPPPRIPKRLKLKLPVHVIEAMNPIKNDCPLMKSADLKHYPEEDLMTNKLNSESFVKKKKKKKRKNKCISNDSHTNNCHILSQQATKSVIQSDCVKKDLSQHDSVIISEEIHHDSVSLQETHYNSLSSTPLLMFSTTDHSITENKTPILLSTQISSPLSEPFNISVDKDVSSISELSVSKKRQMKCHPYESHKKRHISHQTINKQPISVCDSITNEQNQQLTQSFLLDTSNNPKTMRQRVSNSSTVQIDGSTVNVHFLKEKDILVSENSTDHLLQQDDATSLSCHHLNTTDAYPLLVKDRVETNTQPVITNISSDTTPLTFFHTTQDNLKPLSLTTEDSTDIVSLPMHHDKTTGQTEPAVYLTTHSIQHLLSHQDQTVHSNTQSDPTVFQEETHSDSIQHENQQHHHVCQNKLHQTSSPLKLNVLKDQLSHPLQHPLTGVDSKNDIRIDAQMPSSVDLKKPIKKYNKKKLSKKNEQSPTIHLTQSLEQDPIGSIGTNHVVASTHHTNESIILQSSNSILPKYINEHQATLTRRSLRIQLPASNYTPHSSDTINESSSLPLVSWSSIAENPIHLHWFQPNGNFSQSRSLTPHSSNHSFMSHTVSSSSVPSCKQSPLTQPWRRYLCSQSINLNAQQHHTLVPKIQRESLGQSTSPTYPPSLSHNTSTNEKTIQQAQCLIQTTKQRLSTLTTLDKHSSSSKYFTVDLPIPIMSDTLISMLQLKSPNIYQTIEEQFMTELKRQHYQPLNLSSSQPGLANPLKKNQQFIQTPVWVSHSLEFIPIHLSTNSTCELQTGQEFLHYLCYAQHSFIVNPFWFLHQHDRNHHPELSSFDIIKMSNSQQSLESEPATFTHVIRITVCLKRVTTSLFEKCFFSTTTTNQHNVSLCNGHMANSDLTGIRLIAYLISQVASNVSCSCSICKSFGFANKITSPMFSFKQKTTSHIFQHNHRYTASHSEPTSSQPLFILPDIIDDNLGIIFRAQRNFLGTRIRLDPSNLAVRHNTKTNFLLEHLVTKTHLLFSTDLLPNYSTTQHTNLFNKKNKPAFIFNRHVSPLFSFEIVSVRPTPNVLPTVLSNTIKTPLLISMLTPVIQRHRQDQALYVPQSKDHSELSSGQEFEHVLSYDYINNSCDRQASSTMSHLPLNPIFEF